MKVVINSSPLIALGTIGKLDLLSQLFEEIIIPSTVFKETVINGKNDQVKDFLKGNDSFKITSPSNLVLIEFLNDFLDKGEAEVIALAKELNIQTAIIDEAKGRKIARSHDIGVMGSLGVLLLAKEVGIVEKVKEHIEKMIENNIWIGADLMKAILRSAGE